MFSAQKMCNYPIRTPPESRLVREAISFEERGEELWDVCSF